MAYQQGWVSFEDLKKVVKTEENPFGELSPEQFKEITGKDFN